MLKIIANANAGKIKKKAINLNQIDNIISKYGKIVLTSNLNELYSCIDDCIRDNTKIISIIGGDGSQQRTITEIIKRYDTKSLPIILPIKGGTMNMLVNDLGYNKSPLKLYSKLIEDIKSGDIPSLNKNALLVKWKDEKGDINSEYGFYFSLGVVFEIMSDYNNKPASIKNALRVTGKAITKGSILSTFFKDNYWNKRDYHIKKEDESEYISEHLQSIMAGTIKRLAFGFKPFSLGKDTSDTNHFDFITYSLNMSDIALKPLFLLTGKITSLIKNNRVKMDILKNVIIKCNEKFILDGDVFGINNDIYDIYIDNFNKLIFWKYLE